MTVTTLRSDSLIANLREIARALSAAWEVDSTLDLIARKTAQVMQVDSCSIYLLDREGETLWLRASTGLAHASLGRTSLKMGQGLTGWAAQHAEPAAVRDAQADERFYFLPQTRELNFKSLLAVPLVNRDRVIGALNVQTRALHEFTEEEIELAALISDLAAGALDRALLYDSMNRQITELTTLARVSETVNAPLYLDEMLAVIVEMAAKVMGTPVCTLRLLDEPRQQLVVRAAWSTIPNYQRKASLRLDQGINGIVVRERQPVAILDVRTDARYPFPEAARREGLVSLLSVPLIVRERVIGVLNCYTTDAHVFAEQEIALAATLANQTALAIENAQLVTNAAVVREMHHRVRNNLQTVALLLRMQTSQSAELSARDVLPLAVSRILSIAAVHDVLAQEGYRLVNVKDVSERIVRHVSQSMVRPGLQLEIHVAGEELILPSKMATSLALVVNELLQNALEHAFPNRDRGAVQITLGRSPQEYVVEVTDDGVGLPDPPPPSLGLEIVEALVHDDLRGRIEFLRRAPSGTHVIVRFPPPAIADGLE